MKTKIQSILIAITLLFLGLLPQMQAVSPVPDGCYPNFTTAEGCDALSLLTTGEGNSASGWRSLFSNSTGSFNTGVGAGALVLNTADSNTAVGAAALLLNTTGTENVAVGTDALVFNDSGDQNTANGAFTLFSNTTGTDNTANGASALFFNTATGNTAIGSKALLNNTTGGTLGNINGFDFGHNVAVGWQALESNTVAGANTAVGYQALQSFTSGPGGTNSSVVARLSGFKLLPIPTVLVSPTAALATRHSGTTRMAIQTRQLVSKLFFLTPPASATWPLRFCAL